MPPQERPASKALHELDGEAGDVPVGVVPSSSKCAPTVVASNSTGPAKTASITDRGGCDARRPPSTSSRRHPPLRVCCYGSSSSSTPEKFLSEAYELGRILALRGHTCVNGAGAYGCMAAMNEGAADHGGRVVGVIHEMFLVDGKDWASTETAVKTSSTTSSGRSRKWAYLRSGAHRAFDDDDADAARGDSGERRGGGRRELLVAGGDDLRERKRLLVEGADALVVLPGGPGTWDELMEMACARNVGLTDLPIVCVNVDGYYDPFRTMLKRSADERLIKHDPADLIHFEPTSVLAVDWVERELNDRRAKLGDEGESGGAKDNRPSSRRRSTLKRRTSSLLRDRGRSSAMGDALVHLVGSGTGWVGGVLRGGGGGTGAKGWMRGGDGDFDAAAADATPSSPWDGSDAAGVIAFFSAGFALGIGVAMAVTTMGSRGAKSH